VKTLVRRCRGPVIIVFLALLLATSLQRRLAELDFDWSTVARIEKDDVEGDEIINRLTFIDDVAAPEPPLVADVACADVVPLSRSAVALLVVDRLDSRGPPPAFSSFVV
jgi:hypothetical protein